jgi:hypothetical protein
MPRNNPDNDLPDNETGDLATIVQEVRYVKRDVRELKLKFDNMQLVERLTKLEMMASILKWVVAAMGTAVIGNVGYIVTQLVKGK